MTENMVTNLVKIRQQTMHLFDSVPLLPATGVENTGAVCHPIASSLYYIDQSSHKLFDISLPYGYTIYRQHIMETIKGLSLSSIYRLIHESYKLTWFQLCKDYMTDDDYAWYLKSSWLDEDDPNQDRTVNRAEAISYFKLASKQHLMNRADLKIYQNLPETITIYRGVSPKRARLGLSWTADKEIASWYKKRYESGIKGQLLTAAINKKHILAYIDDLNEKELIVDVFSIQSQIQEVCI